MATPVRSIRRNGTRPAAIAAAMMAGILFRFGTGLFASLESAPLLVLAMFSAYLLGKRMMPRYAVFAVLAVATNKRSDLSEMLLEKLDLKDHFAAVVGPDRVSARKPSGAHLIEAVAKVGGDPARAIMVGDAAPDVEAARDAGMPCVLTTFGYTPAPVEDLGGDVLIDAFEDVEEAIDGVLADHYVRRALG